MYLNLFVAVLSSRPSSPILIHLPIGPVQKRPNGVYAVLLIVDLVISCPRSNNVLREQFLVVIPSRPSSPLGVHLVKIHWSVSEEGYLNGTRVFVSNCFMFVLLALPHPLICYVGLYSTLVNKTQRQCSNSL